MTPGDACTGRITLQCPSPAKLSVVPLVVSIFVLAAVAPGVVVASLRGESWKDVVFVLGPVPVACIAFVAACLLIASLTFLRPREHMPARPLLVLELAVAVAGPLLLIAGGTFAAEVYGRDAVLAYAGVMSVMLAAAVVTSPFRPAALVIELVACAGFLGLTAWYLHWAASCWDCHDGGDCKRSGGFMFVWYYLVMLLAISVGAVSAGTTLGRQILGRVQRDRRQPLTETSLS